MISTRSIALGLTLAAVGLAPAAAVAKNGGDDPATHAGDDRGAIVTEPGDDKGAVRPEPGDDKGAVAAQPGDDKGGSRTEPGDDNGGQRAVGSKAKRAAGTCTARSSAKLKVKPRNGRLETQVEGDQNPNGGGGAGRNPPHGQAPVKTGRR